MCAPLCKASFKELGGYICDGGEVNISRAKRFCTDLGNLENELLARRKVQEDRDKQREQRKKRDVQNRAASGRHADILRRVAQTAQLPGHSEHLQRMRGVNAAEATRTTALSGDDQMLLPLFDAIKGFADADDSAEPRPLPSGLTGFQRAMVHQYCDELGVKLSSKGAEPNRCMLLVKLGEGANEPAADRFKRQLGEVLKERNTMPEERDSIMLGVPGWKQRYFAHKFPGVDQHGQSATLGSAPARLLHLLRARLAAPCSSALPGRAPATGIPATASAARASRLQSRQFHRVSAPFRWTTRGRSAWPLRTSRGYAG